MLAVPHRSFGGRRVFVEELAIGVAFRDAALFGGEFQGFLAIKFGLVHEFINTSGEGLRGLGVHAGR